MAQKNVTHEEVQALVERVRKATPGTKENPPPKEEALKGDEIQKFDAKMEYAINSVGAILKSKTAIAHAFGDGVGTDDEARQNFAKIVQHLTRWRDRQAEFVTINRSPNAGYMAFNLGSAEKARLTVATNFFDRNNLETAGTLIHEASHGICRTSDLAYMGASYFAKLRDSLALKNADHYHYALTAAKGGDVLDGDQGNNADALERFQQALSLCHYKASKVGRLLMYIGDYYDGVKYDGVKGPKTRSPIFEPTRK